MAQKLKLTKRAVEALRTEKSEEIFWDVDLTGLGLRVFPSGVKTYTFQYRSPRTGTTQKVKLGRHGAITVEQARAEAKRLSGRVAAHEDPASDLKGGSGVRRPLRRCGDRFGRLTSRRS